MRPAFDSLGQTRRAIAATLLALLVAGSIAVRAPLAAPAAAADLRARTATLLRELQRSISDAGLPFAKLQSDFIELAAELEKAGLDSLAADARLGAARAAIRQARPREAEPQLTLAVAAALRARDRHREMRARLLQLDSRVLTDPGLALRSVRELMPRVRALGEHSLLTDAHYTEAHAQDAMGNFGEALVAYQQAAAEARRAGDTHQRLMALSQSSQALRFLGRHPEALGITDSVIVEARREGLDAPLGRALFERASMLRTSNRLDPALAAINEAIAIQRRRGDRGRLQNARLLRGNVYAMMERYADAAADAETLLAEIRGNPTVEARAVALRGRSLIGLGRAAEADTFVAAGLGRAERYRAGLPTDRDRAAAGEHVITLHTVRTRARLALGDTAGAWRVSEAGRAVALERQLHIAAVPDLRALRARLGASHAAMLQFDITDPLSATVFVVTADTVAARPLRWPPVTLADLNSITDRASAAKPMEPAREALERVSRGLLADIGPLLGRGIERVVVSPPARIASLPFELLTAPGSTAALGERFIVSYVPSASVWMALDRLEPPRRGLTVVADPAVDPSQVAIAALEPALRSAVRRPLPAARGEAQRMAKAGATVLVGRAATIERLTAAPRTAMLHFATHAFDDPADPGRGGLVLAGRDPILTPARVESLGVSADLVTLAACGTLGTTAHPGDATLGLARAFLIAGSRTVVTTRWDVSDAGAARFMQEFYAALRAGHARDRALAEARTRLLALGFPPRDCWAFALMGVGDRPIEEWAGNSGPLSK